MPAHMERHPNDPRFIWDANFQQYIMDPAVTNQVSADQARAGFLQTTPYYYPPPAPAPRPAGSSSSSGPAPNTSGSGQASPGPRPPFSTGTDAPAGATDNTVLIVGGLALAWLLFK